MSKKTKNSLKGKKQEISAALLAVLRKNKNKSFNHKQLAWTLQITDTKNRNTLISCLSKLVKQKQIKETGRGKYQIIHTNKYINGILDITGRRNGYVISEELENDVFVSNKNLNKAFNGDLVEVCLFNRKSNGRMEGEITKVISRKKSEFVGVVEESPNFAFVVPVDNGVHTDFFITKERMGGAKTGDKVLVRLLEWSDKNDSPHGEIIENFGKAGDHQTEIHAILAHYGLPYRFEDKVEDYAKKIDVRIKQEEINKRRDLRQTLTFTIDPADAKDFDDALSFKQLENGIYEVGIHIADVSHYVRPGNILDEEAFNRGTSVYLVDRVVPMLPEVLSNFACSLRPNEEKYTFSAIFKMNDRAEILDQWFGRTVINSNQRFAYEEAQHIIETGKDLIPADVSLSGKAYQVSAPVKDAILVLNALALKLTSERMAQGALSFDAVEVKFKLDENNQPRSVYFKEAKEANKLIEEFMLLANKKVAEFIGARKNKKTFVYRIHDKPDPDKLQQLSEIVSSFGYEFDLKNKRQVNQSLNKLLSEVKGKKEQNMIDTLAIRTMSKAVYSTKNIGHYGLGFEFYTHFTSPIRRYPDITVHRLLQHYLENGNSVEENEFEEACQQNSNAESLAASAERDSIKYMQLKFMELHEPTDFKGVISGVTEWGLFIEIIENKCEGMVRTRDIRDDVYYFDDKIFALVGQRKGKKYQLGDEVWVNVKQINLSRLHLDFNLLVDKDK